MSQISSADSKVPKRKSKVTSIPNNASIPSVALITVSLDPQLAEEIADSASAMLWAVHRADCDGYISAEKRPPFPPLVKASHLCVAVIDFDKDIDQAIDAAAYIQELYGGKAALIACSASQDHQILLRAMRAGCNDFIGGEFN